MAKLIWQKEDYIGEDIDLVAAVWKFDNSDEFENNLKYKFQATDYSKGGKTVLRYDNANDAHASRHHKHIAEDETEEIENPFKGINPEDSEAVSRKMKNLWLKFKQEVENLK